MASTASLGVRGFYSRVTGLAALTTALEADGSDTKVKRGYPTKVVHTPEEYLDALPAVYYWTPGGDDVRPGLGEVDIRCEIVVPAQRADADAVLRAVDDALVDGLFEEWWMHDGTRFRCYGTSHRDKPAPQELVQRMRRFRIGVG